MPTALISRIGFWSSAISTVAAVGFCAIAAVAFAQGDYAPKGAFIFSFNLVLTVTWLVVATSIHFSTAPEKQIWSFLGVAFAAVYTAVDSTVFYTQLTAVLPSMASGETALMSPHVFNPGTFQWATEFWGCSLLSVSACFLFPVFASTGPERWLRWSLMVTGATALPIALSVTFPWLWRNVVPPIWGVSLPLACALLTIHFLRKLRSAR